ncbi:MAG: nuclear transport factor 2 family protein [Chloroflexales bacterium]|nr:nuclear transport factor 2 family protein [Chloroflexales bacterium]
MTASADLFDLATQYLAAIERGATGAALAAFFTDDVLQEEFPNRLVPAGARRDLAAILDGAVRGQQVMTAQRFTVLDHLVDGSQVALEVQWTGTLAIPLGSLPAGGQMRARFAVFLTYRDGKIAHQRNYDCFEPW